MSHCRARLRDFLALPGRFSNFRGLSLIAGTAAASEGFAYTYTYSRRRGKSLRCCCSLVLFHRRSRCLLLFFVPPLSLSLCNLRLAHLGTKMTMDIDDERERARTSRGLLRVYSSVAAAAACLYIYIAALLYSPATQYIRS